MCNKSEMGNFRIKVKSMLKRHYPFVTEKCMYGSKVVSYRKKEIT